MTGSPARQTTTALALLAILLCPLAAADATEGTGIDAGSLQEDSGWRLNVEGAGGISQALDSVMRQLGRERLGTGLTHLATGAYKEALQDLQEAYELAPNDPEIAYHLGLVLHRLGKYEDAEHHYRLALQRDPTYASVYLGLADLALDSEADSDQLAEMAQRLALARELTAGDSRVIHRQARVASRQQHFAEAEQYYREVLAQTPPDDTMALEMGDFYRDHDRPELALQWYRQVADNPALLERAGDRIWRLEVDQQAQRFGWARKAIEVSPRIRNLQSRARILFRQRRYAEAQKLLEQALKAAPQYTQARKLLGDLLLQAQKPQEAELEYLRGLAFDQGSAELHANLGNLYLERSHQDRAADAVVLLQRALQLRPDWGELQLQLARAHRRTGDLPRAYSSVRAFLATAPPGEKQQQAQELEASLKKLLSDKDLAQQPQTPTGQEQGPPELVVQLNRARAHLARGETGAAIAELRRTLSENRSAELRNFEGRILHAAGQLDEAAAAFEASLGDNPEQPGVHQQLAMVLWAQDKPEQARQHLQQAEDLGDLEASYHLARLDLQRVGQGLLASLVNWQKLLAARNRLTRFVAQSEGTVHVNKANVLRRQIDKRLSDLGLLLLILVVCSAVAAVLIQRRRFGGADLQTLLSLHPESGPEIQRLLSAIRHEVLKHNTMVLTGLVETIERGENSSEQVQHLLLSLFGDGQDAVVHRFRNYAKELGKVGRVYGLRLNLRRRDAALTPIFDGFRLLSRLAPQLSQLDSAPPNQRQRVLGQLRIATDLLNKQAYQSVQQLLQSLRVLRVDREMVLQIFEQIRREPAMADVAIQPLQLESDVPLPIAACLPHGAFQDVLSNLFRNAVQSSIKHKLTPIEVGLGIKSKTDSITGIEKLLFEVRDKSPQTLTPEQLHGQKIEGGLGLSAEILTKYDGSLAIGLAPEDWTKAVVAKILRGEIDDGNEESQI